MLSWLLPVVGYLIANGLLGITSKLALRDVNWQVLLFWTALAYSVMGIVFLVSGVDFVVNESIGWIGIMGILVPGTLVLLFIALTTGDVSRVVPIGAAYPAVTVLAAALFLDEPLTLPRVLGTVLVIVGVILVSTEVRARSKPPATTHPPEEADPAPNLVGQAP